MGAHLRRLIGRPQVPARSDILLAAAFLVYGLGHVWLDWVPDEGHQQGALGLNTVAVLLATVPLAWRRAAPLRVFVLVFGSFCVSFGLLGAMGSFYAGLVPSGIAAFTVARHASRRDVLVGIAVTIAGELLLIATSSEFRNADELLFDAIVWPCIWVVGWTIRVGETRARELGRRAERLEREREAQARAAVVDERARIARELHDVVAHGMSLMVVQAGAARSLLNGSTDPRVTDHLRSLEACGRQSLTEMRRLLTVLRDDDELALDPLPGMDGLDALVAGAREAGVEVKVEVEGDPEPLAPGIDLTAYRIVQEALTNTIKHAAAAHAQVTVRYGADTIELEVVDNGRGNATNVNGTGHGLIGMRERVALYRGELQAGPRETGGYAVCARLPISAET